MPDNYDENDHPKDDASTVCEAARRMLEQKYRIKSEFLRVNDLAALIGIAASSVRVQISEGRFPIPHRKVGNVIVVKVDDYIEWHRGGAVPGPTRSEARAADDAEVIAMRESSERIKEHGEAEPRQPLLLRAETSKQQADRIKQEVLASMRRRKFK